MKTLPGWIFALAAGCAAAITQVPERQEYTLTPGVKVALAGTDLTLTFLEAANDSRCPSDVVCVWAGNAETRFRLEGQGSDTTLMLNTTTEPREAVARGVRITLAGLEPGRTSTTTVPPASYRAKVTWTAVP